MTTVSPITGSPASFFSTPLEVAVALAPVDAPKPKPKVSKPRKRVNTAEKRNQHNAIERARRETLNGKFLGLARLLPSLAASRRPSKSAIVNGSIDHLTFQRDQRLLAANLLKKLCAERDELLNEVNSWRKVNGCALKDSQSAWTDEMEEIANVEKEVFGSFASMGEDGEGDDEDLANESSDQINAAMNTTTNTVNGLITPRSSTDFDATLGQQNLFAAAPINDARGATAGINGINWSSDFALGLNSAQSVDVMQFGSGHMTDATGSSPVTSHQSMSIVTPPNMSDMMYTHTPSPASSNGGLVMPSEVIDPNPGAAAPWTPAQFAMIQQQVQQAQQAQLHQAQAANQLHQQPFNPITGNTFNAMFHGQQLHPGVGGMRQQPMNANVNVNANTVPMLQTDAFTQSLVASMFPQHGLGKVGPALGPVSMEDLHKAIRTGVGLGLGMANHASTPGGGHSHSWQNPVEGF